MSAPSARPSYVGDQPEDEFTVLSIGSPFHYIIPGFDVLSVELCQIRIAGNMQGTGPIYDIFDKASSTRSCPAAMRVKDFLRIEVFLMLWMAMLRRSVVDS